jgi:hypothetical protein
VGTNVDYTIRSARSCARMSLSFAISLVSGRLNLDLKRGSARHCLRWRTLQRDVVRAHAQSAEGGSRGDSSALLRLR